MTPKEAIEKAIRHFECVRDDAQVVLDSGFGTHEGESDLVYRNRKMYAELAIEALEKQIPKKPYKRREHKTLSCYCSCKYFLGDERELQIIALRPTYCPNCGQRLNWGEEE